MSETHSELDCICENVDSFTGTATDCVCKTWNNDEIKIKNLELILVKGEDD